MEFNGIATAKNILIGIRKGRYTPEEIPDAIDTAIQQLDEQIRYIRGNNPNKVFGYPKTYDTE